MEIDYEKLMANKSEQGLMTYLDRTDLYTEKAVVAAIRELQKRGRQFSEQELESVKSKIEEKKKAKTTEHKEPKANPWTKNVVTDESAPAYYSHRAIWAFSTIFTVIFGAVLLSSNLKDKGDARWTVLGFGILYTGLAIFLLSFIPTITALTIGVNGIGAWIMTQFFWNKYIGAETKYRTQPIWKPLVISIIITIPFLLAIIYGAQE
jgi:hypothetical protein